MTPVYLNPPSSSFSLAEEKEDQHLKLLFNSVPYQSSSSSSSSSLSAPPFFNSVQDHQDQSGTTVGESQERDHKADKPIWKEAGSSSDYYKVSSSSAAAVQPVVINDVMSINGQSEDIEDEVDDNKSKKGSVKWMSSKMRLMQKMMNVPADHIPAATHVDKRESNISSTEFNTNNTNTVRVCSDCNTTTTPLWRSGPRGPKSLCNACGIRQRKARRAMSEAAAAAAANGFVIATDNTCSSPISSMKNIKVHNKEKKSRVGHIAQYKNKCKLVGTTTTTSMISSQRKLCSFNDFGFGHGVFPQDVAEAAILLMELSCGFIHS